MLPSPRESIPPVALGVSSIVLGTIGLVLVPLPVLAVPIAVCGVVCAATAAVSSRWRASESLRWALAGLCTSLVALSVGVAINYAPVGEEPGHAVPAMWQEPPAAPAVPPPARPGFMENLQPSP